MDGLTSQQLINQGIYQICSGDKRKLDEALSGQGWRYVAAAICIAPLTLLKCLDFMFTNKHLFHDHKEPPMEERRGVGLSMKEIKRAREVDFLDTLEDYNAEVVRRSSTTNSKYDSIVYLEKIIGEDLKLEGAIVFTKFSKFNSEELIQYNETGELPKPFMTQRVTFGNEVNKALKIIFPLLKHRKVRGHDDTYLVFEGDEIFQLERKLRDLYMKPVTIVTKKIKDTLHQN